MTKHNSPSYNPTVDNEIWTFDRAHREFHRPFNDLVYKAHQVLRQHFDPNEMQVSTLLNIKKGGCPENCSYCGQSAFYSKTTGVKREPLMDLESIMIVAKRAKANGSQRFCMGAAWRQPRDEDLEKVCKAVREVKKLGMETCVTLGMLQPHQAEKLKESGLDYYNHNIDTSPEYYDKIITTRTFRDRMDTLCHVKNAGLKICCGGILGMGESNDDRIRMLIVLAKLPQPLESVPINQLARTPGTPLEHMDKLDPIDLVRTIALTRIMMPRSRVRLTAGRIEMTDELQALCFFAGANSIHFGEEQLLVTKNPSLEKDESLMNKLGLHKKTADYL